MSYRLIVWDFDGTLADTLALSVETYNAMAVRYGFLPLTDFEAARGLTGRAFFRRHGVPYWRLPALAAEYRVAVKDHMPTIRLFAGVADVLRRAQFGPPAGSAVLQRLGQHPRLPGSERRR